MKKLGLILWFSLAILLLSCNNQGGGSGIPVRVSLDPNAGGVFDGQTDVSSSPTIVLKFSAPVNPVTVNSNTVILSTLPLSIASSANKILIGSITSNINNTTFSFSPTGKLLQSVKYYITVTNGVKTPNGNTIVGQVEFNFKTGSDTVAPTVSIINPSNPNTGISLSPSIQIMFSEAVQGVESPNVTLRLGSPTGNVVPIGTIIQGTNNSYTFSPTSALNQQTTYYVVLTSGITDLANNTLEPINFSFTTGDFSAPTVNILQPTNNATNVITTPTIQIMFSESVLNVESPNVTLHQGSVNGSIVAIGNITKNPNSNSYTFSPASSLNLSTIYYVVLTNGITDLAGNKLDPVIFNFTTKATLSWETVGSAGFSAGEAFDLSLAIAPSGTPYLGYQDNANNNKATVMSFNGTSWQPVGTPGFSAGAASYTSLAISPLGSTPYIAYADGSNGNKATVMSFNGTSWQPVGTPGFSPGAAPFTSLAISTGGTLYIGYRDDANDNKATVMKFNGESWQVVGTPGISIGIASEISLAIAPDGTPYIGYRDVANGEKATVMSFNGTSWQPVGTPGFSDGAAYYTSLAISPLGSTPYIGYTDAANGEKATVMSFNGTSWQPVGTPGISSSAAYEIRLVIAPNGTPYIAYNDVANGEKATVMSFNGISWQPVGTPGFSPGAAYYISLGISPTNIPYIGFIDETVDFKAIVMKFS